MFTKIVANSKNFMISIWFHVSLLISSKRRWGAERICYFILDFIHQLFLLISPLDLWMNFTCVSTSHLIVWSIRTVKHFLLHWQQKRLKMTIGTVNVISLLIRGGECMNECQCPFMKSSCGRQEDLSVYECDVFTIKDRFSLSSLRIKIRDDWGKPRNERIINTSVRSLLFCCLIASNFALR